MPLIKWRDSYSVGVAKFDLEHKVLVELINNIYSIIRNGDDQVIPEYEVAELISYTQAHFKGEEEAMEACGYEFSEEHKKIHAELEVEVLKFKEQLENFSDRVVSDLYLFLRNWLLNHILEEDMKYRECLNTCEDTRKKE